jgi:hypothetical protein
MDCNEVQIVVHNAGLEVCLPSPNVLDDGKLDKLTSSIIPKITEKIVQVFGLENIPKDQLEVSIIRLPSFGKNGLLLLASWIGTYKYKAEDHCKVMNIFKEAIKNYSF